MVALAAERGCVVYRCRFCPHCHPLLCCWVKIHTPLYPIAALSLFTMSQTFSDGLCSFYNDWGICCTSCFCPCYQKAKNKAMADNRDCSCWDCICCASEYFTRQQIRSTFAMEVERSACNDCCLVTFCPMCVICQDGRELKFRRARPSAGPGGQTMSMAPAYS